MQKKNDYPLSTIKDMVNDNDIVPNPDYQREYVYDDARASKLVESILMGIPIPTIYLCQEDNETYSVIDGQQRITSFVRFLNNEFALKGLKEYGELNGQKYKDLSKDIQRKIKMSTLSTIAITKESQELKYEIFARLNQGSVKLKPQELRNCLYRGSFNNLLENLAVEKGLNKKQKKLPDLFRDENSRKSYQERILRFFALRNFTEYKSSMLKTMNDFMLIHQNDDAKTIKAYETNFKKVVDAITQILGETAFCGVDRKTNAISNKFSGSVYDSIIIPFSYFDSRELIKKADIIRKAIYTLKTTDEEYKEDTYAATGSGDRVRRRIMKVYKTLIDIVGHYGSVKDSRIFDPAIKDALFTKGYKCSYCGNEILKKDDAEIDHIVPFSKGGTTDITNAQLLHRLCNREKYNKDCTDDFETEDDEG